MERSARDPILIVGGGAMGLSIGWRLAAAGRRVTVLDAGKAGRGAVWAAAGILAARLQGASDFLARFQRLSQDLWPDFAAELEAAADTRVGYRREGTIVLAHDEAEAGQLRRLAWAGRDEAFSWLDPAVLRERERHLPDGAPGGLLSALDHQVDNRAVAEALATALVRAGGVLEEEAAVRRLVVERGRVTGVETEKGFRTAGTVVLAAGAWSGGIPGLPAGAAAPVRPVKGQMLALRMDPQAPLLRHVLWAGGGYLVPRGDGRLVVGATTEERGFDPRQTAGGLLSLLATARTALPASADLEIEETWVGFRPGSPDHAPILGPSGVDGLVLATGHSHNGILMTPATASLVSHLLLTGELDPMLRPFTIDRFRRGRSGV